MKNRFLLISVATCVLRWTIQANAESRASSCRLGLAGIGGGNWNVQRIQLKATLKSG